MGGKKGGVRKSGPLRGQDRSTISSLKTTLNYTSGTGAVWSVVKVFLY